MGLEHSFQEFFKKNKDSVYRSLVNEEKKATIEYLENIMNKNYETATAMRMKVSAFSKALHDLEYSDSLNDINDIMENREE